MVIKSLYDMLALPFTIAKKRQDRKYRYLRRAGDQARDTKKWSEAIQFYERYLALLPAEGRIWVQLGHVRKESGLLNEAEAAYLTAQTLMPKNADLLLQLGHLFKLQGRRSDAIVSYAASLQVLPSAVAYDELTGLDEITLANTIVSVSSTILLPATYLQISDLLSFLEHHKTVSGIQRVQLNIIEHIIRLQEGAETKAYQFVHGGSRGNQLFLVDAQILKTIVFYLSGALVDHGQLRGLITKARSTTTLVSLNRGDTFFVLGSYWGHGGSAELLRSLKARGVKTGLYFYDIIPLTHPEFCDELLTAEFTQALLEAVHFIDFGLAISDFTRDEVAQFLRKNDIAPIPLHTVPLAHSIAVRSSDCPVVHEFWPDSIAGFKEKRFVLCVGTIEIRKNHRYLFEIWKALIEEEVDVPCLLFIGRQGWRVDDLIGQLKATAYLNGYITILHDISDVELSCLYRHCLFTTFPSLVEGWGLPIGESLSFGKLCVASNTSAMPEVGGAFVEYVDPLNARAAIETFRRLIDNPSEVATWEARISARFQQRDWSVVSSQLLDTLFRVTAELPNTPNDVFVPRLQSGTVFEAGVVPWVLKKDRLDFGRSQLNLIFHEYWRRPTEQGMQMLGAEGKISFRPDTGDRGVTVLLRLSLSGDLASCKIIVNSDKSRAMQVVLNSGESAIRLPAHPNDDGHIQICLRVERRRISKAGHTEHAKIIVRSLGYVAADNTLQWVQLLEQVLQVNDSIPASNNPTPQIPLVRS